MNKQVRMKDVADRAGVSRMTVSLALRDHPKLPLKTRERVKRVAKKLGYQPNPEIASLMKRIRARRGTGEPVVLGLITEGEQSLLSHAAWKKHPLVTALNERVGRFGYCWEEFRLGHQGLTPAKLTKTLKARGINAVIAVGISPASLAEIGWENFVAVELGTATPDPVIHRANNHPHQAMELAIDTLGASGYQRIGLVLDSVSDQTAGGAWQKAFYGELMAAGKSSIPAPLVLKGAAPGDDLVKWLKKEQPDAVVTTADPQAMLKALRKTGHTPPKKLGLAHLNLNSSPKGFDGISGTDQNSTALAIAAVDLLMGKVEAHEFGEPEHPESVMVATNWVQGKTTNPPTKKRSKATRRPAPAAVKGRKKKR